MASESSLVREVARLRARVERLERGSRVAAGASLENASLQVHDDTGSLRALIGQQADGTTAVNVTNGPVPPTPTAPAVDPALGALSITWDGMFTDAQAAPLDWARCEVHIGPDAGFTPTQGTLRDTIETPQGGTVTVPLPYTEWWVKLRSRTTAGVAGPASPVVSGMPRKVDAPDIQAGAVTADAIAADAITGKTITGGEVNGVTVTGGVVQTAASGRRVLLTPTAPDPENPGGTVPALTLHSGSASEVAPGTLRADADDSGAAYPYADLLSPAVELDPFFNKPVTARLRLVSPEYNVRAGSVQLQANTASDGDLEKAGNALLYGYNGTNSTDASHLELYCEDGVSAPGGNGTSLGPRSWVLLDGAQVRIRTADTAGDTSLYVKPGRVEATGILKAGSIAYGSVNITPSAANTPTPVAITGIQVAGTTFHAFATALSSVPGTSMLGVSVTGLSATGLTVWLTRANTITTTVYWLLIGA